MRIGLDIMGGDNAPEATIKGAILAQQELSPDDHIILIGDRDVIVSQLQKFSDKPESFTIEHTPEIIGMSEQPTRAIIQKPKSSIARGFALMKKSELDAFASAGNSGAMVVGSIYSINTVQGVIRPCTSTIVPKEKGGINILLDVGTNPDVKPDVLYQFGLLGSIYAEHVFHIENPRVGLLNIGSEASKGSLLSQSTYNLMKDSKDFNFTGNIEGRDLFKDWADVIVCDGFTGNILLKEMEAMYRIIVKRGIKDEYIDRMNYENYGGTPLLGVNGSVILGHGISNDVANKNMIMLAKEVHDAQLSQKIHQALLHYSNSNNI